MIEQLNILLFDVDGVIVDPLAYKACVMKTLQLLCSAIGLYAREDLLPTHSDIAFMEAQGIHDVWDMSNIIFALLLLAFFDELREAERLFKFASTDTQCMLKELATRKSKIARPDYVAFATRLSAPSGPSHPPDLALQIIAPAVAGHGEISEQWLKLLRSFLIGTRSAYESYGTRIFQNIILGSAEFENTYGLESAYEGPSLLRTEDQVLFNATSLRKIRTLSQRDDIRIAIYTARPSYPPPDAETTRGYSPEAEIALDAAGLQAFPLVGMGMMEWLAARHNERTEELTKPNTTHSLSALIAALRRNNESHLLELAHSINHELQLFVPELKSLARKVCVFVFEDTVSGIKPLQVLAEKLNALGAEIEICALGIAMDIEKKKSLTPLCRGVFDDVNQALDFATQFLEQAASHDSDEHKAGR